MVKDEIYQNKSHGHSKLKGSNVDGESYIISSYSSRL